jgi:hypothetical protein
MASLHDVDPGSLRFDLCLRQYPALRPVPALPTTKCRVHRMGGLSPRIQLCADAMAPLRVDAAHGTPRSLHMRVEAGTEAFYAALEAAVVRAVGAEVRYASPFDGASVCVALSEDAALHRVEGGVVVRDAASAADLVVGAGVVPIVHIADVWVADDVCGVTLQLVQALVYPAAPARVHLGASHGAPRVDAGFVFAGEAARLRPHRLPDLDGTRLAALPAELLAMIAYPAVLDGVGRRFRRGALTTAGAEYEASEDEDPPPRP